MITFSITIVVLVIVYLAYSILKPKVDPCESIFQQTSLRLSTNLDIIKTKGPDLSIEEAKIQDLTEHSQEVALQLKTCCILLYSNKISSEQFLRCKDDVDKFETQVEKVAANIGEAQAAKQQGTPELVNEKVIQINQNLNVAGTKFQELHKRVIELKAPQPTQPIEKSREVKQQEINFQKLRKQVLELKASPNPPNQ